MAPSLSRSPVRLEIKKRSTVIYVYMNGAYSFFD